MLCRYCGNSLQDQDQSCRKCGQAVIANAPRASTAKPTALPVSKPTALPVSKPTALPVSKPSSEHKPVRPGRRQAANQPSLHRDEDAHPTGPSAASARRHRHQTGSRVLMALILLIIVLFGFVAIATFLGSPKNLGIRYTQADTDSVMKKAGLQIDFMGMSATQYADFIKDEKGRKLDIADYQWQFASFQEKRFELTAAETTAFINEVAPQFTWFDKAQVTILDNGQTAGSYRVDFTKLRRELIADVAGQIPAPLSNLLPGSFNLYLAGKPFTITENEITLPAQLDVLKIGPVSLRPFIGDTDAATRTMVMDYVERIYKQIPQMRIHSLKVNVNNRFEFSGYIPTKVTITKKAP